MRSWGGALFSLQGAPKLPETPLLTVQVAGFGAVLQTLLELRFGVSQKVSAPTPTPKKTPSSLCCSCC